MCMLLASPTHTHLNCQPIKPPRMPSTASVIDQTPRLIPATASVLAIITLNRAACAQCQH